jgi:hypothetical protein
LLKFAKLYSTPWSNALHDVHRIELALELPNNEPVNRCVRRENATLDHWMASSLPKEMPNEILEN